MSQQSLILKFFKENNNIVIFDTHNDHQLKTLGVVATQEQFDRLNTLVRNGDVSFEYLLSDAVQDISDISKLTESFKSSLQSHFNMTTAGPANNEANKPEDLILVKTKKEPKFKYNDKIYVGLIPYIFIQFLNDGKAHLQDSKGKKKIVYSNEIYLPKTIEEHTGGSSSYYRIRINYPTTSSNIPYSAECNDIIEALELTYAEANVMKAVWRIAAERQGKKKKGNNSIYDAEKIVFFGPRILIKEQGGE